MEADDHRMAVRQIGDRGADLHLPGGVEQRRDEHHAVRDVLDRVGQVLAAIAFAVAKPVGQDERLAILLELNWDAIKKQERAERSGFSAGEPGASSALDGVPFGQPALALAAQLQRRAERAGVPASLARMDGDIGAELFRLVAQAREAGLDPRWNFAPPHAATATRCGPGSGRPASLGVRLAGRCGQRITA